MNDKKRKVIVRSVLITFILSIFVYIFWPASSTTEEAVPTTIKPAKSTTTTSTLSIVDTPCILYFNADKATFLFNDLTCVNNYAQRYFDKVYSKLLLECRSSSDGQSINRRILSDARTKTVQLKLVELQVPNNSIIAKSLADTKPIARDNLSPDELKMINRSCIITGVK